MSEDANKVKDRQIQMALTALRSADQLSGEEAHSKLIMGAELLKKAGLGFGEIIDAALDTRQGDHELQNKLNRVIAENTMLRARMNFLTHIKNSAANVMDMAMDSWPGKAIRAVAILSVFPVTYPLVRALTSERHRAITPENSKFAWAWGSAAYVSLALMMGSISSGINFLQHQTMGEASANEQPVSEIKLTTGATQVIQSGGEAVRDESFDEFSNGRLQQLAVGNLKLPHDGYVMGPGEHGGLQKYFVKLAARDDQATENFIQKDLGPNEAFCKIFTAKAYPVIEKDHKMMADMTAVIEYDSVPYCREAAFEAMQRIKSFEVN